MPVTAQAVLQPVVDTLQDPTSIRWPMAELARYFNDGQREVVLHRPDASYKTAAVSGPTGGGSKVALPADGAKLIEVSRNTTSKTAVTLVSRSILDLQTPSWHALTPVANAVHYMYDPREPRSFYVYPPILQAASLDIVYSAHPSPISEPAPGSTVANVTGNLDLPDIYANAVKDYILYRAYMKDAEFAGNLQRAQAHYAAFANALGIEVKATVAVQPTSPGSPNVSRQVAA
jgi:hypothetical protein